MEALNRRAWELLRAAALIAGSEPGLLTQEDRQTARRRGAASAKRVLSNCKEKGKPHIGYYRAITSSGIRPAFEQLSIAADKVWLLEDRCGLADSYLRAVADAVLQYGSEVILCPSPLRRDRIEAVFLPGVKAAYLSDQAAVRAEIGRFRHVHLDRIPDSDRRQAMRFILRDNRNMIKALVDRAVFSLAGAEILSNVESDSCAGIQKQI